MNLRLTLIVAIAAFLVAFATWYIAGRRTLYVQRLNRAKACRLVWLEELFPFIGFGGFLLAPTPIEKFIVAIAAATGGCAGLWVAMTIEINKVKRHDKLAKQSNIASQPPDSPVDNQQ